MDQKHFLQEVVSKKTSYKFHLHQSKEVFVQRKFQFSSKLINIKNQFSYALNQGYELT